MKTNQTYIFAMLKKSVLKVVCMSIYILSYQRISSSSVPHVYTGYKPVLPLSLVTWLLWRQIEQSPFPLLCLFGQHRLTVASPISAFLAFNFAMNLLLEIFPLRSTSSIVKLYHGAYINVAANKLNVLSAISQRVPEIAVRNSLMAAKCSALPACGRKKAF